MFDSQSVAGSATSQGTAEVNGFFA